MKRITAKYKDDSNNIIRLGEEITILNGGPAGVISVCIDGSLYFYPATNPANPLLEVVVEDYTEEDKNRDLFIDTLKEGTRYG
jgi:hypothetical protein